MITACNLTELAFATVGRPMAKLNEQFAESRKLEKAIRSNLETLGF